MKLALVTATLFVASTGFVQASTSPSRVQVGAREFSFVLSRQHVRAGSAVVEIVNYGQDPHDLRLQRAGDRHIASVGEVSPGAHADLSLKLPPGRYSLWCPVGDHRSRGMRATLVVTR